MKFQQFLEKTGMASLKLKTPFLEAEWNPKDADKQAAWALYVELLTRITTQPLDDAHGDEKTALDSVYALFALTRHILKENRGCDQFAKIAIVVLNQVVRPFTAKWHKLCLEGAFKNADQCQAFRTELKELQKTLQAYSKMLAEVADVEDLTDLNGY